MFPKHKLVLIRGRFHEVIMIKQIIVYPDISKHRTSIGASDIAKLTDILYQVSGELL
jgi:hypothetical protein